MIKVNLCSDIWPFHKCSAWVAWEPGEQGIVPISAMLCPLLPPPLLVACNVVQDVTNSVQACRTAQWGENTTFRGSQCPLVHTMAEAVHM